jgi:predicted Rossmann-fold nucleotide-binding protein
MFTSVAIFCGSSSGGDPRYSQQVEALAEALVQRNVRVVYGGARVGAMGVLADSVLRNGGEVVGVMPQQLMDY